MAERLDSSNVTRLVLYMFLIIALRRFSPFPNASPATFFKSSMCHKFEVFTCHHILPPVLANQTEQGNNRKALCLRSIVDSELIKFWKTLDLLPISTEHMLPHFWMLSRYDTAGADSRN